MLKNKFMTVFIALILIASGEVKGQYQATLTLPDTSAAKGDTIDVAIQVSTSYEIGLAQFIIEFDTTVVQFIDAVNGADAAGFVLSKNLNLPFPPTSSAANKNILLQLSGGGISSFTGQDKKIAVISFIVKNSTGSTPLIFDQTSNHTFLSSTTLTDISGGNINFIDGSISCLSTEISNTKNWPAPMKFNLMQNYPNPFNPRTTIEFTLPEASFVTLKIFDATGREVKTILNEKLSAGTHRIDFDAGNLPSGVYFYQIKTKEKCAGKKFILLR